MTGDRDPIDAWLGADVEPLPAPPGAFERVRRRARRRKAIRAVSTAAGAAVIVAAAAILPQFASGLLNGPPPSPYKAATGTAAPGSSASPAATKGLRPTVAATVSGHGRALFAMAPAARPAAGFRPVSVTFGTFSVGAVLGEAGQCGIRPCTVMAGTADYAAHWAKIAAPPAGPADGAAGVSQIRFLGEHDGWAYGPALYATHDGGVTWHRLATAGRVIDLSAVAHRVFAVIGSGCTGSGPNFAAGCSQFALYSAASSGDRWQAVPGAAGSGHVVPGALQLSQDYGYLIVSGRLYAGPVTGRAWQLVRPTPPSCLTAGSQPPLIAPNGSDLFLLCRTGSSNSLSLYHSPHRGSSWRAMGAAQVPGTATSLAVSPAGTLVLGTTAGIYYSPGGRGWHAAGQPGPRGGFIFVGMTSSRNGVAVPADSRLHEIFVTRDGGRNWTPSPIG